LRIPGAAQGALGVVAAAFVAAGEPATWTVGPPLFLPGPPGAPEGHPVIPGASGFRKARWARQGKGKSGGFRVVYFFLAEPGRIYIGCDLRQIAKGDPFGGRSQRARKTRGTDQESGKGRAIIMGVRNLNTASGRFTAEVNPYKLGR
jgi:hypothetical protein